MTDSWRRCSSHSSLPGNKLSSWGHLCFGLPSWLQPSGLWTGQRALGTPLYIEKGLIFRYEGTATVPLKSNMWVLATVHGYFYVSEPSWLDILRHTKQVCVHTIQWKSMRFMQYCQNTCKKTTNELKLPCVCFFFSSGKLTVLEGGVNLNPKEGSSFLTIPS